MSFFSAEISITSRVKNAIPRVGYIEFIDTQHGTLMETIQVDSLATTPFTFSYEGYGLTLTCGFKDAPDLKAKKFSFDIQGRKLHPDRWDGENFVPECWYAIIPKQKVSGCTYLFDLTHSDDNFEEAKSYFDLNCTPTPDYSNILKEGAVTENLNVSYDINVNVFKTITFARPYASKQLSITLW
jgi:hypothetical protein